METYIIHSISERQGTTETMQRTSHVEIVQQLQIKEKFPDRHLKFRTKAGIKIIHVSSKRTDIDLSFEMLVNRQIGIQCYGSVMRIRVIVRIGRRQTDRITTVPIKRTCKRYCCGKQ